MELLSRVQHSAQGMPNVEDVSLELVVERTIRYAARS